MKHIVLGIIIASASFSFAQNDKVPTHQLKKRFSAKQNMVVKPASADVKDQANAIDQAEVTNKTQSHVLSRKDEKSSIVTGVIQLDSGLPFILLKNDLTERRLMPMNLPKDMAVNGQELQFSYMVSGTNMTRNADQMTMVSIYDVSMSPRK